MASILTVNIYNFAIHSFASIRKWRKKKISGKRQNQKLYLNDSYSESDEKWPVMMIQYKCNIFHVVFVSKFIKMNAKSSRIRCWINGWMVALCAASNICIHLNFCIFLFHFIWMMMMIRIFIIYLCSLLRNHFHIRSL